MYYWIQNSEDGVSVSPMDHEQLLDRIYEETSADMRPDFRAEFIDDIPDAYTATHKVCIVKGEIVVPQPVIRIEEYEVP